MNTLYSVYRVQTYYYDVIIIQKLYSFDKITGIADSHFKKLFCIATEYF